MLFGEQQHAIDAKGRLVVPVRFREGLGEKFIVTRGLDKCLFIYPLHEWNKFEEKLSALPLTSKDARKFVRYFFSGATECEMDGQSRIMIPQNLREHAGLKKEVVSAGKGNIVEVWDKETWNTYMAENFVDDDLAEAMEELGI